MGWGPLREVRERDRDPSLDSTVRPTKKISCYTEVHDGPVTTRPTRTLGPPDINPEGKDLWGTVRSHKESSVSGV